MPLWVKLRLWTSPAYLRSQVFAKLRTFFSKLFDVRPRHKRDYYPLSRWLVSKRLAFALVVLVGITATFYVAAMMPKHASDGSASDGSAADSIPTYQYRAVPLKFKSGTVRILARDGHLAYVGQVDKGACSGSGTLYDARDNLVYKGQFANNMFHGNGTLYYPGGGLRYTGSFTENLFNGAGSYYRSNGSLEYEGDYVSGVRTGQGKLFNSTAGQVFEGSFLNDGIVYSDFLDKPTRDAAALYTGVTAVYQGGEEYCVSMPEINAVYAAKDGSGSLENEWTVTGVYVLDSSFPLDGKRYESVSQLRSVLGEPLYYGTGWVNLPEAVALNHLAEQEEVSPVDIKSAASFDNVFSVSDYDQDASVYLYTFERDGLLYTFYSTDAGVPGFLMYAIESAGA